MDISSELHPRIHRAIREFYSRSVYQRSAPSADQTTLVTRYALRVAGAVFTFVGAGYALSGGIVVWFAAPHAYHPLAVLVEAAGAGLLAFGLRLVRRAPRRPDELITLAPLLGVSPLDEAYCGAMVALARTAMISASGKRQLAREINALFDSFLRVCDQRAALSVSLGGSYKTAEIQAEHAALASRLSSATDSRACDALRRSLELCEVRLNRRRTVEPHVERLDGQAAVISQMLHNVQEVLAGLSSAAADVPDVDADSIARSISEVNIQTSSIEAAVQELLQVSPAR